MSLHLVAMVTIVWWGADPGGAPGGGGSGGYTWRGGGGEGGDKDFPTLTPCYLHGFDCELGKLGITM